MKEGNLYLGERIYFIKKPSGIYPTGTIANHQNQKALNEWTLNNSIKGHKT